MELPGREAEADRQRYLLQANMKANIRADMKATMMPQAGQGTAAGSMHMALLDGPNPDSTARDQMSRSAGMSSLVIQIS